LSQRKFIREKAKKDLCSDGYFVKIKLCGFFDPNAVGAERTCGRLAMTTPQPPRHWARVLAQVTSMTSSIAGSIVVCSWLGYQAGRRFGHITAFILLGFAVGLFAAFMSLWRFMRKNQDL
jgi:hypothetical protein